MARNAVQSRWMGARYVLALAGVFLLLVLCGQWSLRVAAGSAGALESRVLAAYESASAARTAFLRARIMRLEKELSTAAGGPEGDAAGSLFRALDVAAARALSTDTRDVVHSIRVSAERWFDDYPLPDAYDALAAAMEEARAAELERQFDLLFAATDLDRLQAGESLRTRGADLKGEAVFWAVGAPLLGALLVLTMLLGARRGVRVEPPAGIVLLDGEGRIVYADEGAAACAPRARGACGAQPWPLSLETAAFSFSNGPLSGESLIAGLESGDAIRLDDGRTLSVSRMATDGGGAVLTMTDISAAAALGAEGAEAQRIIRRLHRAAAPVHVS